MKLRAISLIILLSSSTFARTLSYTCAPLLAQISEGSSSREETYINLVRALAKNKNAITASDIQVIASQSEAVNPFTLVNINLSREDYFAFELAFKTLVEKADTQSLDWKRVREALDELIGEKKSSEGASSEAREVTNRNLKPELIKEFKYDTGEGSVKFAFTLPDGTPMAIYNDGNETYLYDFKRDVKTHVGTYDQFNLSYYRSQAGLTWFSILYAGTLNLYEITPKHEFKVVVEKFKTVEFLKKDQGQAFFVRNNNVTIEGADGRPKILEILNTFDSVGAPTHTGYLEIEVETGRQNHIPLPIGHNVSANVHVDGHIISHYFVGDEFIVSDLTTKKIINKIKTSPGNWPSTTYLTGLTDNLVVPSFNRPFTYWLDVNSGKILDVSPQANQMNQPIVLVPKADGRFHIIFQYQQAHSVAVYDPVQNKMLISKIPEIFQATRSEVLEFKETGPVLLIGASASSHISQALVWLSLSGGHPLRLDLSQYQVTKFVKAWETLDRRVEALFESEKGFKVVQLYGPAVSSREVGR